MKSIIKLAVAAVVAGVLFATGATAQTYPNRVVRIVVPQAPGGASDALARIIGQKLSERWKQPVVVENRAGAGGVIGTESVAKCRARRLHAAARLRRHACGQRESLQEPAVRSGQGLRTGRDARQRAVPARGQCDHRERRTSGNTTERAKANPGKVTYGSAGNGSVNHLLGAMFGRSAGVQLVHVPYKGAAPAITDLLGGSVDSVFTSVPSVVSHVQGGRVRALAVTSAKRSAALPNVPTLAESGLAGVDVAPWFGLLAPAATPPDIVRQINDDRRRAAEDEGSDRRLCGAGCRAVHDDAGRVRRAAEERHR